MIDFRRDTEHADATLPRRLHTLARLLFHSKQRYWYFYVVDTRGDELLGALRAKVKFLILDA